MMTSRITAICLCAVGCIVISSASAKSSPKKHPKHPRPAPQQPAASPIGSRAPSSELGDFFGAHLDQILAPLDQRVALPRNQVTQLRESFTDRFTKAPANEKPAYQAAISVCNALAQTMDERERAVASLQGSASVHGPSDLGAHRKDDPSWRDLAREHHEERSRKQQTAQNDDFLTTQRKTSWTQRTVQLRQHINQLYAREREAERQAQQSANPGSGGPTTNTITLDKPIQVKVKYGAATIPAGTTLTVVSRDANGIVVDYGGEQVRLPP
jgi:hypothetical protein